ncbi:sulfotransferase family protein [Streptomyces adelaidensis]|uniref:sulfotransferase family protein n=1 Tax=Streptomyces adelaidensis TaxID=2796465 RepID=UPI003555DC13
MGPLLDGYGYRSGMDWPTPHAWHELADLHPDAKLILTIRDPTKWQESIRTLLSHVPEAHSPLDTLPDQPRRVFTALRRLHRILDETGQTYFGPDWTFSTALNDEATAVTLFEEHTKTVTKTLPADRLLIFDVREGWAPLCTFLNVDTPAEPFPHRNDRDTMRTALDSLRNTGPMH